MANTVNTISGKQLEQLHIVSPKEIAAFVPGVTAVNAVSGSTPIFSIRGIGLDDYIGTNMGGIGIYQDGVFAPYPVFYNGQMFDVQTVSVEKGPQGFEYGRSTTGGSINVESTKPSSTFGGYLNWGYSSYNTNTSKGAINVPITDRIFNRFAFSYIKGDGWQHDIHDRNHLYGAQDLLGLRNLTRFDIDDRSSLMLNIHYTRDRGTPTSPQDVSADSVNNLPDRTIGVGPNAKYNDVNVGTNKAKRNENGGGVGLNYTRHFDWGTFTSATGIDFYRRDNYDNYDGESVNVGDYRWNDTYMVQSHDMHLQTTIAKRLHLTVGVYESYDKIDGAYTSYRSFLLGTPNGNLTDHFSQQNLSTGLYLNTVTNIVKGLDFIAGGRLSYDERGFHGGTTDDSGILTGSPGSHLTYLDSNHTYERLTGKVGLRYTIMPGTIVYGTISNGYKAGSYFAAPVSSPSALDYVKPENVIAYEIGAKTSLLHNKLQFEGSLFDYEYHNRQTLFVAEMPANITSLSLGTIPRARTRGGELSATLHDLVKNLDVNGSFAYLDGRSISSVTNIKGLPLLSNVAAHSSLPFAPRFSWSAYARYGIDVSKDYRLAVQVSYTWKDNMLVALGDPNGKTSKVSSMGMRMEFGPKSDKWTAAVYVDNMLNEHGNTYSYTGSDNSRVQYLQTPRWLGCDLRYNF
ncbi:TonB-dependent receptor plug domain-containing protein [Acetobacter sp. LMG 1627]|uniref:TonB-dependent receptor plug domain-containing protein n=2 Tax=Acetobacter conturbans TaxID=1737472 RepID=A0ABX0K2J6_9PROT|nr:TonB-dependent receptor [Acetobacter conturbans]NHN88237.1 TonB-dependent receptor plug domain-containing protein [Acetobacter conturbans]